MTCTINDNKTFVGWNGIFVYFTLLTTDNTNNCGFLYTAKVRHAVTLMELQHFYLWSPGLKSFLKQSQLLPNMLRTKLINHKNQLCPSLPLGGEKLMVKCLARGHKCHDLDSNPHSTEQKHQSLSSVLLSARPRHPTWNRAVEIALCSTSQQSVSVWVTTSRHSDFILVYPDRRNQVRHTGATNNNNNNEVFI